MMQKKMHFYNERSGSHSPDPSGLALPSEWEAARKQVWPHWVQQLQRHRWLLGRVNCQPCMRACVRVCTFMKPQFMTSLNFYLPQSFVESSKCCRELSTHLLCRRVIGTILRGEKRKGLLGRTPVSSPRCKIFHILLTSHSVSVSLSLHVLFSTFSFNLFSVPDFDPPEF